VLQLGQCRPRPARAPGNPGRDRTDDPARPAPASARGRCNPRRALRASRGEEEIVQLPYLLKLTRGSFVPCRFSSISAIVNDGWQQNSENRHMRLRLRANFFRLALGVIVVTPAWAAEPAADQFKTEIEGVLDKLAATTNGLLTWDGS